MSSGDTKKPGSGKPVSGNFGSLPGLVGYHLRRAQKAVFNHFSHSLADLGISPGQFGVLTLIEVNEGLGQSALASILGIERSTMVAVIDGLEAKGWVERQVSETDRRSKTLILTKAGVKLLKRAGPQVADHERQINAELSGKEKDQLIRLLGRVADAAERR